MKTWKHFICAAILAVIGIVFTACGDGGGNNSNNSNDTGTTPGDSTSGTTIAGAATLPFNGEQVHEYIDRDTYKPFTGDRTVYNYYTSNFISKGAGGSGRPPAFDNGGSGNITNGKLTYSIGKPNRLDNISVLLDGLDDDWTNVKASDTNVNISVLNLSTRTDINYGDSGNLYKYVETESISGNKFSGSHGEVLYIYVDKDVTITGKGYTEGPETDEYNGVTETWTEILKDLNIALKAGWNSVYFSEGYSGTFTGTWPDYTSITGTMTYSITLSNPSSARWELYE